MSAEYQILGIRFTSSSDSDSSKTRVGLNPGYIFANVFPSIFEYDERYDELNFRENTKKVSNYNKIGDLFLVFNNYLVPSAKDSEQIQEQIYKVKVKRKSS